MINIDLMVLAGDYVKTAVISEWKVKEGDLVKKGDVLLEVETNKITQEIEAPCDGIIEQILFREGDDVEISKTVAVISDGSDKAAEEVERRTVITPVAKKMAKEKGINPDELAKMFPGKRIGKKELLVFEEMSAEEAPVIEVKNTEMQGEPLAEVTEIPVKGLRKAVAEAMRNSAYSKPHVTMMVDAQLDELLRMKAYLNGKYPERKITITGLLALAVRSTLLEYPYMNGTATENQITLSNAVNLGIAVDVEGGLLVPVIKNSDRLGGFELFEAVNSVARGCREGILPPSDYAGGTFTISNLGTAGVKYFTPVINFPEIAILGVGSSVKETVLVGGQVEERTVIGLSLSFDHAAVDGAPAGKFLKALKEKIEHPYMVAL